MKELMNQYEPESLRPSQQLRLQHNFAFGEKTRRIHGNPWFRVARHQFAPMHLQPGAVAHPDRVARQLRQPGEQIAPPDIQLLTELEAY